MSRYGSTAQLLCAGGLLVVALAPAAGQGHQQQTFHKPMAPIGPTSEDQCRMLEAEWSRMCKQISDAHQQCLDSYNGSDVKGAGECSRGPCLSLHNEMTTCGGAERQQAVSSCYAQVRGHKDREADFQRRQAEAVRQQQEAERARRDRLMADAARSGAEAEAARRRAEAYRQNTPSTPRPPTPDADQARIIDDLRSQADTAASTAGMIGSAIASTIEDLDFSRIEASSRDLLRNEGMDLLMYGVAQMEPFDEGFEQFEKYSGFADVATGLWNGGRYLRDRLNGELPPGPDWSAMLDSVEFLSSTATNIPILNLPTLGPVGNVVRGLRNAHEVAYRQLDALVQAFLGGTPAQLGADFDGDFFRALLNPSIPLERIERLNQAAKDASYTIENSWDGARNRLNLLFNP